MQGARVRSGTLGRRTTLRSRPAGRARARFRPPEPARVRAILEILKTTYPDARTALDFASPLQLLIATILSAQCTDARVNQVTPVLFARYPDAASLAAADRAELARIIASTGCFLTKAKTSLRGTDG